MWEFPILRVSRRTKSVPLGPQVSRWAICEVDWLTIYLESRAFVGRETGFGSAVVLLHADATPGGGRVGYQLKHCRVFEDREVDQRRDRGSDVAEFCHRTLRPALK